MQFDGPAKQRERVGFQAAEDNARVLPVDADFRRACQREARGPFVGAS